MRFLRSIGVRIILGFSLTNMLFELAAPISLRFINKKTFKTGYFQLIIKREL